MVNQKIQDRLAAPGGREENGVDWYMGPGSGFSHPEDVTLF